MSPMVKIALTAIVVDVCVVAVMALLTTQWPGEEPDEAMQHFDKVARLIFGFSGLLMVPLMGWLVLALVWS